MKALILAAGLGTRLRPLTEHTPKCLIPIGGKPILEYHLDSLQKSGISEVLINTHYLPDQVEEFLGIYRKDITTDFSIHTAYEPELLGSAGTLKKNRSFFKDEENFLVVYADNLTTINYKAFTHFHIQKKGIVTIACYHEKYPEQKGMVIYDQDKKIIEFKEKPKEFIASTFANGGIYVCNQNILEVIETIEKKVIDFGFDVFPKILSENKRMYAYLMDEFLLDIGTIENYTIANKKINNIFP